VQDWRKTIVASRNQLVATQESYKTIQTALCRLIDSIQLSIANSKPAEAHQKLGQLKDGVNAAWETVITVKTDKVALLDAVESLVPSTNLLLSDDQIKSGCRIEVRDDAVAAVIRYLDPDQNRNSPWREAR
jgi:preprotein translocase subunit SecA